MSQLYITVCWISRAARRVSVAWIAPAATAASSSSISMREIGAITAARRSGSLIASCNENSEIGTRLCAPRLRRVPSGSHHSWRRIVKARKPLERLGFGLDGLAEVLDRLADGLLEQREQQLVLAVEVLVEARAATASSGRRPPGS